MWMSKFLSLNFGFKNLFLDKEADVAKLVDALDLGPSNFCFESSSLSIRSLISFDEY